MFVQMWETRIVNDTGPKVLFVEIVYTTFFGQNKPREVHRVTDHCTGQVQTLLPESTYHIMDVC